MSVKVVHRKLGKEQAWGQAHVDGNKIELDIRLKGYRYLLYAIHEHTHMLHPEWSETRVKKESSKIAMFLWERGFRKVDQ